MSAHEQYARLVGEMGVSRKEFLYDMKNWEIQAFIKGFYRRAREAWAMTRWHAWWSIHNGMVDWSKQGLRNQRDMITFPWEKEEVEISEEDVSDLMDLMNEVNKKGE